MSALGQRIEAGNFDALGFAHIAYLYSRGQINSTIARDWLNQLLTRMSEWVGANDELTAAEVADIGTILSHVDNGTVVNGAPMTSEYVISVMFLAGHVDALSTDAQISAALGL